MRFFSGCRNRFPYMPIQLEFAHAIVAVGIVVICVVQTVTSPAMGQAVDSIDTTAPANVQTTTDTNDPAAEEAFLNGGRQLTFEGRRAGEGYFSKDGTKMVFQSEREPGNPFFQIYLLDMEFGDIQRISPGLGKTTCAWIHPDGNDILFASTHDDVNAKKKQDDEIELRASGKERRYAWDYDENFDLYAYNTDSQRYIRLTDQTGYDAEGSYSPDGQYIAFASNRHAYTAPMSTRDREMFERDPAYMMEIYIMKSDGTDLRRLTNTPGYDGGPFFSPDGNRICWRRFAENGATAEIMTMNIDGSDQKQLTQLGAMSWAPYYHPSGEYLIFTTNRHGFANFELYLIDVHGENDPVRVTYTDGFDGLPVFTPDGTKLSWTTSRSGGEGSQIHLADWNHAQARESLQIKSVESDEHATEEAKFAAESAVEETDAGFEPSDIMRHVDYLCRKELGGRLTGTRGEKLATAYVAAYLDSLGLVPAGDDGTWYQEFEFPAGVALGPSNELRFDNETYKLGENWLPLSFSLSGKTEPTPIVFAGYGIVAPADGDQEEYDSFVHLDVKDKWVLVFRFLPEEITPERRQHLNQFASLRYKAMVARDKGALGLIVVTGPNTQVKDELVQLRMDGASSGTSIFGASVSRTTADAWMRANDKSLKQLQDQLDDGSAAMGFELKNGKLALNSDIEQVTKVGRNVIGRLEVGQGQTEQAVLVGAHIDHLGQGPNSSSLARDEEKNGIHLGADDNASGVAAMLEVAQYLADLKRQGRLDVKRDFIFAAWSGEELGLFGSAHFTKQYRSATDADHSAAHAHQAHTAATDAGSGEAINQDNRQAADDTVTSDPGTVPQDHGPHGPVDHATEPAIYPSIAACLNMDMVGRLEKNLVLQGVGSSSIWSSEIEQRNAPVGLSITLQNDSYIPTDAQQFFRSGVPILSAFTGSHSDYHTPRDTPDKLNLEGAAQIAKLMGMISRSVARRDSPPDYIPQQQPVQQQRASLRAYLGTVPDYAGNIKGVLLSDVTKGGPAEKAGVRGGDAIVGLAGRTIENIYDYTYAIEALKIGETVVIEVSRHGKTLKFDVTPGSRQ